MFQIFKNYRDEIIKKYGNGPLYDDQIRGFGKQNIPHFGDVVTHEKFVPEDHKYYVLNTGNDKSQGIHWVGVYISPHVCYVFDSFHRNINNVIKDLRDKIDDRHVVVSKWTEPVQNDHDPKQADICGQLCLAWLECAKNYGIRNAMLI